PDLPIGWDSGDLARTAADGTFAIAGIRPGRWTLSTASLGSAGVETEIGELADGASREGIEIVLPQLMPISGRGVWPDGTPARGCTVTYTHFESTPDGSAIGNCEVHCNSDGQFVIQEAGDQPVALVASAKAKPETSNSRGLRATSLDQPG